MKNRKVKTEKVSRFGVVGTVFVAFFIGEFGDKTQLTTISLAAQYQNAVSVLIGATLGMLVADGLGIAVGVALGKRIPQRTIKWVSATIFLIFGLVGVYEVLSSQDWFSLHSINFSFAGCFRCCGNYFYNSKRDGAKNLVAKKCKSEHA